MPADDLQANGELSGCLAVPLISLIGLLVGAAVLGCCLSGPLGILAAPILAIFGWFVFVPIMFCVAILWAICPTSWNSSWQRFAFIQANGAVGFLLMFLWGIQSPEREWLLGLSLGGYLAAAICAALVILWKQHVSRRP